MSYVFKATYGYGRGGGSEPTLNW